MLIEHICTAKPRMAAITINEKLTPVTAQDNYELHWNDGASALIRVTEFVFEGDIVGRQEQTVSLLGSTGYTRNDRDAVWMVKNNKRQALQV